eukprot:7383888-Prymnesium_polylepis.1
MSYLRPGAISIAPIFTVELGSRLEGPRAKSVEGFSDEKHATGHWALATPSAGGAGGGAGRARSEQSKVVYYFRLE